MGVAQDPQAQQMEQMIQEVAQLLMQGISPEELLQKGVPQQVIEAAIQLVQQQGMGQGVPEQQGLAAGGMMAG